MLLLWVVDMGTQFEGVGSALFFNINLEDNSIHSSKSD